METTVGQSNSMKAIKPINNVSWFVFLIKSSVSKTYENVFKKEGACRTLLLTVTPLLVLSGMKTVQQPLL